MLSYTTKGINNPWTDYDIKHYESEGSQRDKVIYNSVYNSRMILTEENVFLCSIKQGCNKFQNFYLFAVRRNLFYYIMYVPQIDAYRDNEIKSNKFMQSCLDKLALTQKCISSFDGSYSLDSNISISDGTCFFIKVEANIEEFLFPRNRRITNPEILKKYALMNNVYKRIFKENELLLNALGKYDTKVKEKLKKRLVKMLVMKGTFHCVDFLSGIPLSVLFDLDSLFGFGDIVSLSDMASNISIDELIDSPDNLLT